MVATFAKIFVFVIGIIGVFVYVGQLVPQFEEHPPAERTITPTTDLEELAEIGRELVRGKGGCLVCHKDAETGNERGPDLRMAAGLAVSRQPGLSAEEYLIESLVEPGAFIVEGYPAIMPPAMRPPANLAMVEVKAVVAYLQALGGEEPTVAITQGDLVTADAAASPRHVGRTLMDQSGCTACHFVEGEGGEIGPDLTTVATVREPSELVLKLVDPEAWTAEGYEPGLMPSFADMPEGERHEIVAYLASLAGKRYSPTGALSPWSHEGVRLGLVIFIFNIGMLLAIGLARRAERREGR